jgi:hypothetical protein
MFGNGGMLPFQNQVNANGFPMPHAPQTGAYYHGGSSLPVQNSNAFQMQSRPVYEPAHTEHPTQPFPSDQQQQDPSHDMHYQPAMAERAL